MLCLALGAGPQPSLYPARHAPGSTSPVAAPTAPPNPLHRWCSGATTTRGGSRHARATPRCGGRLASGARPAGWGVSRFWEAGRASGVGIKAEVGRQACLSSVPGFRPTPPAAARFRALAQSQHTSCVAPASQPGRCTPTPHVIPPPCPAGRALCERGAVGIHHPGRRHRIPLL